MRPLLLFLVACTAVPTEQRPPPEPLDLTFLDSLQPNVTTLITIEGAPAFAEVLLGGSMAQPAPGPCPGSLSGYCLGVVQPFLIGSDLADADGDAVFAVTPPTEADVCLQAVVLQGPASDVHMSNVECASIAEVTCPGTSGIDDWSASRVPRTTHTTERATYSATGDITGFGGGLGVYGDGFSQIDANETLYVNLARGSRSVGMDFANSTDDDGDGIYGMRFIRAFGPDGSNLGHITHHSDNYLYLSNEFPGETIGAFTISAFGDGTVLESVNASFTDNPTRGPQIIDFAAMAGLLAPHVRVHGTLVHRLTPDVVLSANAVGLGALGGPSDSHLDSTESVVFNFGTPVDDVFVDISSIQDRDAVPGVTAYLVVFDSAGNSGIHEVDMQSIGPIDISSLTGGAPITYMRVAARGRDDGLAIGRVRYTGCN